MADRQHQSSNEAERPKCFYPIPISSEVSEAPCFPLTHPAQYPPKEDPEGIKFDPEIHLANPLPMPKQMKILQEDGDAGHGCVRLVTVPSSHQRKEHIEDLAYTEPFRVLSDAGVAAFNTIISENEKDMAIVTPRNPKIIRGLGFTSKFVKELNESPVLLDHLSTFANIPVCAHPMTTNYSQINYGESPKEGEGSAKAADVWHLDSVDYVLVIMLTDGFTGGELLVSNMDPNQAMERIRADDLPSELTTANKYPKPGYGIFMQGSRIAHAVSPLTGGPTRITAVSSFTSRDTMRVDRPSIYNALSMNHTKQVYDPDYLRNIATRCMWKLEHLVKNPSYDCPERGERVLNLVIDQLTMARRLMKGEEEYVIPLSEDIKMKPGDFRQKSFKQIDIEE